MNENRQASAADLLDEQHRIAAPPIPVHTDRILRIAKRRRARRRIVTSALTCVVLVAVGLGAWSLPPDSRQHRVAKSVDHNSPQQVLLNLADELERGAEPIPADMALHTVSLNWSVLNDGRVRIGKLERTEYPDGAIDQTESSAGPSASLDVGDPLPEDANVTDIAPMHNNQQSWEREARLPTDPADLRAAWVDGCVDPTVGATEYRCVYLGMQEALPVVHDDLAAAVLRVLVAEPGVRIERGTDALGRKIIAATFDLRGERTTSYLIDPGSGEIIGAQLGTVPAIADELTTRSTVSATEVEWVSPVN